MPGSAVLDPDNLLDDLVATIDELRSEIPPGLGMRQFQVYTVLRTWGGNVRGDGAISEVETEITPRPVVEAFTGEDRLTPAGLDEADVIILREVSLTYTEAELAGPADLDEDQEWLIRVKDAYGQGIRTRDFVLAGSPWPDRLKDIGWTVKLRRSSDAEETP